MRSGTVYAECSVCGKQISVWFPANRASYYAAEMDVKCAVRRHNAECSGRPEVKVESRA